MIQIRTAAPPEYYLTPDYETEHGQLEVSWGGKGARMLGLRRHEFGTLSFLRLAKGLNPETGTKLTAWLKANRREAWDVSVTVPKSVSVLIEVMQAPRVKAALLNGGVCVTGRAGSGKTSSSGRQIGDAVIRFASGGVIMAAKPEDAEMWRTMFAAAGRQDDFAARGADDAGTCKAGAARRVAEAEKCMLMAISPSRPKR